MNEIKKETWKDVWGDERLLSDEGWIAQYAQEGQEYITDRDIDYRDCYWKNRLPLAALKKWKRLGIRPNAAFFNNVTEWDTTYLGIKMYKGKLCDAYSVDRGHGRKKYVFVDRAKYRNAKVSETKFEFAQKDKNGTQIGGSEIKPLWNAKQTSFETSDNVFYEIFFKSRQVGDVWGIDAGTIEHENKHIYKQDSLDNVSNRIIAVPKFGGNKEKQEAFLEKEMKEKLMPEHKNKSEEMHNRWDREDGSAGPSFPDASGFYDYDPNKKDSNKVVLPPMSTPPLRVPR